MGGNCGSDKCGCGPQSGSCEPKGGCGCGSGHGGGSCEPQGCGPADACGGQCACDSNPMPTPEQMHELFMDLADRAWMKLMKEKMMKAYEHKMGKHMDEMAQLHVEACMMKWMDFEMYKTKKPEFMQKMKELKDSKK